VDLGKGIYKFKK